VAGGSFTFDRDPNRQAPVGRRIACHRRVQRIVRNERVARQRLRIALQRRHQRFEPALLLNHRIAGVTDRRGYRARFRVGIDASTFECASS